MQEPARAVPLVFDYVELRLRMSVRPPEGPPLRDAGITLPFPRVL